MSEPVAHRRATARPRRRQPLVKRARILAAAQRLFAKRGFSSTTTGEIARAAKVSEGVVFHHFDNKDALLVAVAAEYGHGLKEAMLAARLAPPHHIEPQVRAAFRYVRERGPLSRLLTTAPAPAERSVARHVSRDPIVDMLDEQFDHNQKLGVFRPMDSRIVAELMNAVVERALVECFVRGDGSREEDYVREAVRCIEGSTFAFQEARRRARPK